MSITIDNRERNQYLERLKDFKEKLRGVLDNVSIDKEHHEVLVNLLTSLGKELTPTFIERFTVAIKDLHDNICDEINNSHDGGKW